MKDKNYIGVIPNLLFYRSFRAPSSRKGNKATKPVLLTLVLIFLALSAYKSVLRVSSNDPLAGLAWAIMTVRQLPPRESYTKTVLNQHLMAHYLNRAGLENKANNHKNNRERPCDTRKTSSIHLASTILQGL